MTLPAKLCLCCGREIIKDQFCVETPDQFAKRYNGSWCRAKCKRNLPSPSPPDRPTLVADPTSWNLERPVIRAVEKELTPRSEPYKQFIKAQECILAGGKFGSCVGDVAPHHTESGGMSIKGSDLSCVPLCVSHHLLMDNAGKKGRGIWTRRELETIITRLNEEFNFLQSHRRKGERE